ncbi:MAG TPA: outer membrane protein [Pseudolabrys sp.]
MKKAILAMTLTAMTAAAGPAAAADLQRGPYSAAPIDMRVYNWAGFYAGANVGYDWGKITNSALEPTGFAGGLQAGYNFQSGQFVFGAETDIQATSASDTFAAFKFSNPWFGTVRGRAGYALNNVLFYGTLGVAYGDIKGELPGVTEDKMHLGWTGGLGMEVGLTPNWSAKVEYLYMDLNNRVYSITGLPNGYEANMLRFGVNYHF